MLITGARTCRLVDGENITKRSPSNGQREAADKSARKLPVAEGTTRSGYYSDHTLVAFDELGVDWFRVTAVDTRSKVHWPFPSAPSF